LLHTNVFKYNIIYLKDCVHC